MCCFAGPVKSVSNTNLFARLTGRNTQVLAYQMEFETEELNAMILPIPVQTPTEEDSLRFISLKGYDDFFSHLDNAFPEITPPSNSFSRAPREAADLIDSKLVVHEVGDFVASFVPKMSDFSRLDPQFVIPKSSWDKIPQYADYGFAVFQLKSLQGKPHPMAFEFESRLRDEIFFPTVHIHDGEVHRREAFDHTLYLQNERFDEAVGKYVNYHVKDRNTGFVRSKDVAKRYCKTDKAAGLLAPDLLVHRMQMIGRFENKDIITPLAVRKGTAPAFRYGQLMPIAPVVMGLGWIMNRRMRLKRSSD